MKKLFFDIWNSDRKGFLRILALNLAMSFTGGIGIVMLLPMLELLDISSGGSVLPPALQALPHTTLVVLLIAVYFVLVVVKALFSRFLSLQRARFQEDYTLQLRNRLYSAFTHASYEQLNTRKQADTINLFTAQCGQVSQGVSTLISLLSSVVSAGIQLCIALWMSVPVTILVMLAGVVFVVASRPLRQKSKECGEAMIHLSRRFYGELHHQLLSVKEVRAYGVAKEHAEVFDDISTSFRDAHMRYAYLNATPAMIHSIAASAMIGLVFLICVLGMKMPTAQLVVLVYVFSRLWPVFSGFQSMLQRLQTTVPAYDMLQEAMTAMERESTEHITPCEPLPFEQEVRFSHVSFAYRDSEAPVLEDVSFTLKKGTITALTGRSGEGKTTTADLLLGFLTPKGGEILIDGRPLTTQTMGAWRRQISYVPQTPIILNGSVRENLLRFHPEATEEEMIAALKKAQAWPFVSQLPEGLDTLLGDQGVRLSGGERQRLVLARVLLGNPAFILLDEATSSLDFESECAVRDVLHSLKGSTTILIIAHRLATIRIADQAIVLGNSTVDEYGPLQELLNTPNGYLARMVEVE